MIKKTVAAIKKYLQKDILELYFSIYFVLKNLVLWARILYFLYPAPQGFKENVTKILDDFIYITQERQEYNKRNCMFTALFAQYMPCLNRTMCYIDIRIAIRT